VFAGEVSKKLNCRTANINLKKIQIYYIIRNYAFGSVLLYSIDTAVRIPKYFLRKLPDKRTDYQYRILCYFHFYCFSYRKNAKQLSRLFRDRPQTPLETAIFWTEYVIRHKGAPHLRSAAVDLAWYQYLLLDVVAVVVTFVAMVLWVVYALFKKLIGIYSRSNCNKLKSS
jgi:hypothetical protein